jgi:hypothetical protein
MTSQKRVSVFTKQSFIHGFSEGIVIGKEHGLGGNKVIVRYDPGSSAFIPREGIGWEWPSDLLKDTPRNRKLIAKIKRTRDQMSRLGAKERLAIGLLEKFKDSTEFEETVR